MRPPSPQPRFASPAVSGKEPCSVFGLFHTCVRDAARDLHRPDRPRLRRILQERRRRTALPRIPHERDALPVGRPADLEVVRRRRREIADRRRVRREESDEAVAAAVRDEGERAPVGCPRETAARAAREEQLRRRSARERHRPDLAALGEGDAVAPRRDRRFVAFDEEPRRRIAARAHRPDLDLRHHRVVRRIRRQSALGGPVRVVIAAAHVDERLPVGADRELRQLLSILARCSA